MIIIDKNPEIRTLNTLGAHSLIAIVKANWSSSYAVMTSSHATMHQLPTLCDRVPPMRSRNTNYPLANFFYAIVRLSSAVVMHCCVPENQRFKLNLKYIRPPQNSLEPPRTPSGHPNKSLYSIQTCLKAQKTENNIKTKNQVSNRKSQTFISSKF